jgi:hypothetical protein
VYISHHSRVERKKKKPINACLSLFRCLRAFEKPQAK